MSQLLNMYFSLSIFVHACDLLQSHYIWHNYLCFRYSSLTIFGMWYSSLIIFAAFLRQSQ